MATSKMAISPAAGPDTLTLEPLRYPTTIPAITPQIIPANGGAPLAMAIPRQRGRATKKTTMPDNISVLKYFVLSFILMFCFYVFANTGCSFLFPVRFLKKSTRPSSILYTPPMMPICPASNMVFTMSLPESISSRLFSTLA